MNPTSLYRLFSADGALLYIGIAGNPGRRFEQHAKDKPWWGDVARITVEHFATREEASKAEAAAIRSETPAYNIQHAKGRAVQNVQAAPRHNEVMPHLARRWRFKTRRGDVRVEPLWLYPELAGSACVDDCPSSDGEEQFRFWLHRVERDHPEWLEQDAVPISWFVEPVVEAAPDYLNTRSSWIDPETGHEHVRSFLSYYTWPVDAATGEPLDWFTLPVVNDRFPAFADALGWTPSPLQPTAPIRSILLSRRRHVPPPERAQ